MNVRALIENAGLPRRGFTVKEVERMSEVGLIRAEERVELIGGELVPMNPKGNRHEVL
jgi:signal transduction histidine kinase